MKWCRRRGVRSMPRESCRWTARWRSSPAHRAALGVRSPSRPWRRGRTWRSRTGRTAAARTRPPTAPAPPAGARGRSARASPSRAVWTRSQRRCAAPSGMWTGGGTMRGRTSSPAMPPACLAPRRSIACWPWACAARGPPRGRPGRGWGHARGHRPRRRLSRFRRSRLCNRPDADDQRWGRGLAFERETRMAAKEPTYSDAQIEAKLKDFPGWWYEDGWIRRNYKTDGWPTTLMLVNAIGYVAEAAYHHPDLSVTWGRVIVKLQNHAAGGITDKDFELARKIDETVLWRPKGGALEGTPNKFVRSGDPR